MTNFPTNVGVLLGNGAGGFAAPVYYQTHEGNPYEIRAGDFNGDGNLDLVTANYPQSTSTLFVGDGTGAFSSGTSVPAGGTSMHIFFADFNHDSKLDIAASNSSNSVAILLGTGCPGSLHP